PLRDDACARPRHEDGEERQRLFELDEKLRRADDVEALEIRGLAVDEALSAADRGEEEPAAGRPLLENALEGVTDVAGGKGTAVGKAQAPPTAEAEARAAVLGNDLRGEPRNDAPTLEIA